MEIIATSNGGSARDATSVNSSTDHAFDLTAFVGRYVEIYFDEAAFITWADSATGHTISTSGAVAASLTQTAHVPRRVAADTYITRFVHREAPVLWYKAQSTTITYCEVLVTSKKTQF